MPLFGVRDVAPLLDHAPEMPSLDTDELLLPRSEILHVMFETDDTAMLDLLPPALGPTIPPAVTFVIWRCPEGPDGPFALAQVRVACRAGVRPRGFLLAAYCDSEAASRTLRERWGYNCRPGIVRLRRNYDRVTGSVVVADRTILQVGLLDPRPISGADIQYTANMNLARVRREGVVVNRLVQVDPEYTFYRAERGQPLVEAFEPEAWSAGGVRTVYPVHASYAVADITLPHLRYIVDPVRPALAGTETVNRG
jgi:hypothetical protein